MASMQRLGMMGLLALVAVELSAAQPYKAPRTSWGDPVLKGIYTNNTDVPFERPRELGDKAFFTEAEIAERRARPPAPETQQGTMADVHYDDSDFGLLANQHDMVKNLRTSLITHPANGRLPAVRQDLRARNEAARAAAQARAYDSAQDRPLGERCVIWPHVGPPLRPVAYNTHVQIVQTPQHVVFMTEMIHDARIIPIARTRPDFRGLKRWQGNSWGRWEGDTLVIETTGVSEQVIPRGSSLPLSGDAVIIEKITRTGPGTIRYEFSVTDPGLWESSWGGEFPMEISPDPWIEYACHEGNYGIANTLRGARADEAARARQGR